jgi:hypothetical protein
MCPVCEGAFHQGLNGIRAGGLDENLISEHTLPMAGQVCRDLSDGIRNLELLGVSQPCQRTDEECRGVPLRELALCLKDRAAALKAAIDRVAERSPCASLRPGTCLPQQLHNPYQIGGMPDS